MAVCMSWPQACITPLWTEANSSPVASAIGSASISARSTSASRSRPTHAFVPSIRARTPVPATLRYSIPSCWSASATTFDVRCSSNESSGCWCRLLRHIMTWRNSPSASLMTVCFSLLSISPIGLPGPHTESPKSAVSGTSAPRDTDSPYRHTEQQTPRILPPTKGCKEHASSKRYFSAAAFSPPPE